MSPNGIALNQRLEQLSLRLQELSSALIRADVERIIETSRQIATPLDYLENFNYKTLTPEDLVRTREIAGHVNMLLTLNRGLSAQGLRTIRWNSDLFTQNIYSADGEAIHDGPMQTLHLSA